MKAVVVFTFAVLATTWARRLQRRDSKSLQVSDKETNFDDDMMEMIAASTRAAIGVDESDAVPDAETNSAAEPEHDRPEVAYDEQWFGDNCDINEDPTKNTKYYQDDKKNPWREGKKCEVPYNGAAGNQEFKGEQLATNDIHGCEAKGNEIAATDIGNTFCCEWDGNDGGKCTISKSFLAIEDSSKGYGFNWLMNSEKKYAKFVKAYPKKGDSAESEAIDHEMDSVQESQDTVRKLVEQVNHMSIEGILRHLLSFYICMRWVPDDQYLSVAKHEFQNVDLDMQTLKMDHEPTEDELFANYVNFDAVPLKCSSGMSVQDTQMIDILLKELASEDSQIKEAYTFSKEVASRTFNSLGGKKWSGSAASTKQRMGNKAEVSEMADKARSVLPWDGFIRPSQRFTWGLDFKWGPHIAAPENLFFVCFGPRVSSFPHKRDQGGHFMADMNMAGCNGLWSFQDIAKHVARIRKLFAPETCLTENMKRKLKTVFMETFVDMNKNFEQHLIGKFFTQRKDLMDTIPDELMPKSAIPIDEDDLEGRSLMGKEGLVATKYQRTGRLVAAAHTKWLICDAQNKESPAVGLSMPFFRSPSAYKQWFKGKVMQDPTKPECKTIDPVRGCMRCVFAVRSHPWRCLQRIGLSTEQVLDAIADEDRPLRSTYPEVGVEVMESGKTKETIQKRKGVCIVGKDFANTNASRFGDLDKFRQISGTDKVFHISKSKNDNMGFLLRDRYGLQERQDKYAEFVRNGGTATEEPPLTEQQKLQQIVRMKMMAGREAHYPEERFGPLLTFSDVIPEAANTAAHEVDYFVTCPCEPNDFSLQSDYEDLNTRRMNDYTLD